MNHFDNGWEIYYFLLCTFGLALVGSLTLGLSETAYWHIPLGVWGAFAMLPPAVGLWWLVIWHLMRKRP